MNKKRWLYLHVCACIRDEVSKLWKKDKNRHTLIFTAQPAQANLSWSCVMMKFKMPVCTKCAEFLGRWPIGIERDTYYVPLYKPFLCTIRKTGRTHAPWQEAGYVIWREAGHRRSRSLVKTSSLTNTPRHNTPLYYPPLTFAD